MENLFEKGCLVQLSIGVWRAAKKIDQRKLAQMTESHEWLSATKKLIDPEALKPIAKIGNSARSYLKGVSLPFPLNGMVFVPKDMINMIDEKLQEFKDEFHYALDGFIRDYDYLRTIANGRLGELFNELDYPLDIRQKFSFVWRFVVLDVPNGNAGILSPEVYEREKEKFVQTMEEARELAIQSLREEFASMVSRITERFTTGPDGKPKVFKNSTVNSFYEYFETFKERNIFKDDELAEFVNQAQSILSGTAPDMLRSDEDLRASIGADMATIESKMAEILTMPRRKVVMD
jgi:hypothetical protein